MDKFVLVKDKDLDYILLKNNISDGILRTECYFAGDESITMWFIPEKYLIPKKNLVTANLEYVAGYLTYGHFEAELSDEELEEFKKMSEEDQREYIYDNGHIIVDDYDVNDYGEMTDIEYD